MNPMRMVDITSCLITGKRLHALKWKELPIDDWVIDAVEQMAKDQQQPVLPDKCPIFEWSPGIPVDDHAQEPVQEEHINEDDDVLPIVNEEMDVEDVTKNIVTDDDNTSVDDYSIDSTTEEIQEMLENEDESIQEDVINSNNDDDLSADDSDSITIGDKDEESTYDEVDILEQESMSQVEEVARSDTRPRRKNAGTGVDRLTTNTFRGKFISLEFIIETQAMIHHVQCAHTKAIFNDEGYSSRRQKQ